CRGSSVRTPAVAVGDGENGRPVTPLAAVTDDHVHASRSDRSVRRDRPRAVELSAVVCVTLVVAPVARAEGWRATAAPIGVSGLIGDGCPRRSRDGERYKIPARGTRRLDHGSYRQLVLVGELCRRKPTRGVVRAGARGFRRLRSGFGRWAAFGGAGG